MMIWGYCNVYCRQQRGLLALVGLSSRGLGKFAAGSLLVFKVIKEYSQGGLVLVFFFY